MNAGDIMSTPVVTVRPDTPLSEVARLLAARHISGVPVLEGEELVGLVSEADLLRRLGAPARRASDVMTRAVRTVAPDTPLAEVAGVLEGHGIKRVPVVQEGRVVGIVSRANLVQALAARMEVEERRAQDEAIRRALLAALERVPSWRSSEANVIVSEGIVHYWGIVDSEAHRDAARAAALAIAGVRRVQDHRTTREPRAAAAGEEIRRAADRGHSKHGLVDSLHSFSFGNYYDPAHLGYGPLRALNEKRVQPGAGTTTYGLRDVEVLTYVLAGEFVYEDSRDNHTVLAAGGVQHMSAGSGMRHTEGNRSEGQPCHFLQLWIEPNEIGVQPAYEQRHFSEDEKRGQLRLIASPDGREGSLRVHQDVLLYAGLFDRGERANLTVRPERRAYVHVARGQLTVNQHALGQGDALKTGSPIVLAGGESAEVLALDVPD